MDIDEILQRAETQDSDKITSVGQDLLSQFKVSSIFHEFLSFFDDCVGTQGSMG